MNLVRKFCRIATCGILFASGLAATGLAMAVACLWLIGLVNWTGAQQVAHMEPAQGAVEDMRSDDIR